MKFNRASFDSSLKAAKKSAMAFNKDRYLFPTAYGYAIGTVPPPFNRDYVLVCPNGVWHDVKRENYPAGDRLGFDGGSTHDKGDDHGKRLHYYMPS